MPMHILPSVFGSSMERLLCKERQTRSCNSTKAEEAAALMKRMEHLNEKSRSGLVTVTMVGHSPVITNVVCSARTGQKAKCVDWSQNQGGMNNHTCSTEPG